MKNRSPTGSAPFHTPCAPARCAGQKQLKSWGARNEMKINRKSLPNNRGGLESFPLQGLGTESPEKQPEKQPLAKSTAVLLYLEIRATGARILGDARRDTPLNEGSPMCAMKSSIPDNISEEYYQINPDILSSFSKYRPPLDFFKFIDDIAQLTPYSRKGQRLSNEQIEEVNQLCLEASLFVSRSDHPIYSKHICKQLDLILLDKNLKEAEIADIIVQALQLRLEAFYDQSVQLVFDLLYKDIMVVTEYLSGDPRRIKSLLRRLQTTHTLVNHSINCGIVGLWLYLKLRNYEFVRRDLDRTAIALILHDMGMCKIPQFILTKTIPLTPDERAKVNMHPIVGLKIADKLGLSFNEIKACILEHHERLDQSGYPRKVGDADMTKIGRLCAVVDSFCAMIAERPYAKALSPKEAAQQLSKDDSRYDRQFATPLMAAYITNVF